MKSKFKFTTNINVLSRYSSFKTRDATKGVYKNCPYFDLIQEILIT